MLRPAYTYKEQLRIMSLGGGNHGYGFQQNSTKLPPTLDINMEQRYPIVDWVADIRVWEQSTDLAQRQHGPAIVLALTGLPREIAREVPPDQLANRVYIDLGDGQGNIWHSSVDLVLHAEVCATASGNGDRKYDRFGGIQKTAR